MSNAERQARFRARHKGQQPAAIVRTRRRVDRRSGPQRWHDVVTELLALQGRLCCLARSACLTRFEGTATAERLQAIADLDLDTLAAIDLPQRLRPRLTKRDGSVGRPASRWCLARVTASRVALRAPASAGFGP